MSKATETALKLLESLPEEAQDKVVTDLRQLVLDTQDELRWQTAFARNDKLTEAARKAGLDIAAGKATKMDYDKL